MSSILNSLTQSMHLLKWRLNRTQLTKFHLSKSYSRRRDTDRDIQMRRTQEHFTRRFLLKTLWERLILTYCCKQFIDSWLMIKWNKELSELSLLQTILKKYAKMSKFLENEKWQFCSNIGRECWREKESTDVKKNEKLKRTRSNQKKQIKEMKIMRQKLKMNLISFLINKIEMKNERIKSKEKKTKRMILERKCLF